MTIWLLVLVLTIDPGFSPGYRPTVLQVTGPEDAAVKVWDAKTQSLTVDPTLYEVETRTGKVTARPIPAITFQSKPVASGESLKPSSDSGVVSGWFTGRDWNITTTERGMVTPTLPKKGECFRHDGVSLQRIACP